MESKSKRAKVGYEANRGYGNSASSKKRSKSKSKSKSNRPAALNNTKKTAEMKCYEIPLNQPSGTSLYCSPLGIIIPVNILSQGAAVSQRIGNRIEMRSIRYKAWLKTTSGCTLAAGYYTPRTCRLTLVYDMQTNGSLPSLQDIFGRIDSTGAVQGTQLFGQNINVTNRDRFVILADDFFAIGGINKAVNAANSEYSVDAWGSSGKDGAGGQYVDRFVKLKGLNTVFKSNTGTIGDVTTGALYLIATNDDINDLPTAVGSILCFDANIRLVARDV